MNKALQIRRGTTSEHSTFIGLEGEITLDTDKNTLIIHDGALAGGYELTSIAYSDANYAPLATTIGGYGIVDAYTVTEIDVLMGNKADVGTTLNEYGISDAYTSTATDTLLGDKQDNLVSGTNIKTINSVTVLGSGDLVIGADDIADVDTTTVAPTIGQILKWDLTNWVPGDDAFSTGGTYTGDILLPHKSDPVTAEYWRFRMDSRADGISYANQFMYYIKWYEDAGLTTPTSMAGATYTSSVAPNQGVLSNLLTLTTASNVRFPYSDGIYVTVQLAAPVHVYGIDFVTSVDGSRGGLDEYSVQYSTDGVIFYDAGSYVGAEADNTPTENTLDIAAEVAGIPYPISPIPGQAIYNLDLTEPEIYDGVDWGPLLNPFGIDELGDVDTTTAAPSTNDFLKWDNTNWVPITVTPSTIGAEPADGTILKDADIGVSVQPFDGTVLKAGTVGTSTASKGVTESTLTDAATIAWDLDASQTAQVTLGASRTMGLPTNIRDGFKYHLVVIQGTGGSFTITWDAVFKWPGSTPPTLSTAVGAVDIMEFIAYNGNLHGVSNLAYG
jgi:hypothetical protein